MAIFSAIAGVIVGAIGITGVAATIATGLIGGALAIGVSKLIMPRGSNGSSQQEDAVTGARIQLPPATNNKLPVVYGTAFIGGSIIDAKISTDLQTMWYVIAMSEVTDTGTMSFSEIYYDNKLVTFGANGAVTSLTTNTAGGGEVDSKVNGNLFIYLFPNGSSSGTNTGGQTAIQIMSDNQIAANQRWDGPIYAGGVPAMTNTAFVIVKMKYNQDAGTTQLGAVTAKMTNSLTRPGDCIKDYLLNSRYGCGVDPAQIDNASMAALNSYSDKVVVYTPVGGGTATQPRYRFNGPLDTTKSCLSNLQDMVDACDSWMQYSELTGQWKVVINKAYDETPDPVTFNDLYLVDNNNLVSGITLNPTDLNQTYNQVEYQYPNFNIKDQLDYIFIALQDEYPALLSENEPLNKLTIKNDLVNNFVQAKFIAIRRLLQGREDLIVTFQTDYSGIQVDAGDVIKITNEVYGWTEKLFRVSNVIEEKYPDGSLGAKITAFEYNASIYDDDLDITDFVPEPNTGLNDPNIIGKPNPPTIVLDSANTTYTMKVTGVVPSPGLVRYLDFNYGTSNNSATHTYYTSSTNSNGAPLLAGTSYTVNVNDIPNAANLYWSVTAKNDQVGIRSDSSNVVVWPGSGVTTSKTYTACNASSSGTLVTSDAITGGSIVGGVVTITSGTGALIANTRVANVLSSTQFNLNVAPSTPLSNACIRIATGGIGPENLNFSVGLEVQDEGFTVVNNTSRMNFVGNGVSVTTISPNEATIVIDGAVGSPAFDFEAAGSFSAYNGTFGPFANAASSVNRNQSLVVPGLIEMVNSGGSWVPQSYTQSSSDWDPWFQGTASTSDGFGANSTGICAPQLAQYQLIGVNTPGQWLDGGYGWFVIGSSQVSSGAAETDLFNYTGTFNIVSDVDCNVQIGGATFYTTDTLTNTGFILDWATVQTIPLIANRPQTVTTTFHSRGSYIDPNWIVYQMGAAIKNPNSGANVWITTGSWLLEDPNTIWSGGNGWQY